METHVIYYSIAALIIGIIIGGKIAQMIYLDEYFRGYYEGSEDKEKLILKDLNKFKNENRWKIESD
ncbi:MAG: hypothetical protein ABI241_00645 [Bacteroidia bacterium]